jgi:biotin operon repressor
LNLKKEFEMPQKRMGQYDSNTGEIMADGFLAYVVPKRKNGFGKDWVAMGQEAVMLFAKSDLGADDFRVLMALIAKLDFENLLVLSQADLGREINMQRQHIQRSIKKLIAMGAVLEGPKIGINRSYRLNPNFGWKGSAKNHVVALDEYRKAQDTQTPSNF